MKSDANARKRFKHHIDAINRELNGVFNSCVPLAEDMGRHALLGNGKRLRPLLFVLSCHLCDYRGPDLYLLSTTFESIHTASLLHDDVLDNAEIRRKRPSANRVWGNHAAVLEGDFLYSKAVSISIRTRNIPFFERLTETALHMTEGQMMEYAQNYNWDVTRDQYMEVIAAKTAVLISAACACGGILSEAPPEHTESLSRFGLYCGIAFQLIDDLLDYTSSEGVFGKPVGKDLREGKMTLPLIYTLPQLDGTLREKLQGCLSEETCRTIIERVRQGDALERIREEAKEYVDRAVECLKVFPDSETREDLIRIGRHIVDREH